MFYDIHTHLITKKQYDQIIKIHNEIEQNIDINDYRSYIKLMKNNNIVKSVVFPLISKNSILVAKNNNEIMKLQKKYSEFFDVFLAYEENLNMEKIKNNKIKGIKYHFMSGKEIKKEDLIKMDENKMFLLAHFSWGERIEKIKKLSNNYKNLKIIFAHSGRKEIFTGNEILNKVILELEDEIYKNNNIYFDTSTIRDSKVMLNMVNKIGSDRILFGSDYPYRSKKEEDVYVEELKIVKDLRDCDSENILINNYKRLLLNNNTIRRVLKKDYDSLLCLINKISEKERKFLAIKIEGKTKRKIDTIKKNIKEENHMMVCLNNKEIIGFIRKSDRLNNSCMIEEIFIKEEFRNKGYAKKLIESFIGRFKTIQAKTFSTNTNINRLLEKLGFNIVKKSPKGEIFNWSMPNE